MKIDFATLAFGYRISAGGGTPNWATALGQGKEHKINNNSAIHEMLKGIIYSSVPLSKIQSKIGKGGQLVSGDAADSPIVIGSVFSDVYVNGNKVNDAKFILIITRDTSKSHAGRLRLKYGPSNLYVEDDRVYTNELFFEQVRRQFGLAEDACWFVSDISIEEQKKLMLTATIVNKYGQVTYEDSKALHSAWEKLDPTISDICEKEEEHDVEEFEGAFDVLNHNVFGLHMKKINDGLSDDNPHICIGWSSLGDLSLVILKEELELIYEKVYPGKKARAKGQDVGQIWRFKDNLKIGDYIFYADDAVCHIGRVVSDYYFDNEVRETQDSDYRNCRRVEWLMKNIDRKTISKDLHHCLGTAMSIWSMNDYKSAVVDLLNGTYKIDDLYEIEKVDAEEQKKAFKEWLEKQYKTDGSHYSSSTIYQYVHQIEKGYSTFEPYNGYKTIFDIQDSAELSEYTAYLFNAEGYEEFNLNNGNKACSYGLIKYGEFLELDEINETEDISDEEDWEEYTKQDFLRDVFMDEDRYDDLVRLLEHKKNIILQGAPGVGKTFLAKRLAYSIMGKKMKSHVELVQFHQNYSYEDFIMGYKPTDDGFELRTGIFYNFCKKAEADKDPNSKYYFIIDEINRGNLSKILGELMMLVEGDKRGETIKLAYRDEEFGVPENVFIIGMMNTADRSLAMMDYALRRRFSFFDIEPAFETKQFKLFLEKQLSDTGVVDRVIKYMTELNKKIADEGNSGLGKGFCIGHSYFCVPPIDGESDQQWYESIVDYEITPMLNEYWWDDPEKAAGCVKDLKKV